MGQTSPGEPQYITVTCPVCGTRLDEIVRDRPRTVRCPDCHTGVAVPARAQIPVPTPPKPLPDVGTYRMQIDAASLSPVAKSDAARRQARRERAMVLVKCPLCAARIDTLAGKQPRAVKCPDCHEPVRVPPLVEVTAKQKGSRTLPTPQVEALHVPAPDARPVAVPTFAADAQAHIRREVDSPPPRRVFLSGVFSLPWHAEVFPRWLYLSFGLIVMNLLIAFLTTGGAETAGSRFGMVIAFFVLPLFWVGTWTLSYAAACCRAILEDTAAGNRQIVSWHEQNWREWVLVLAWFGYLAGITFVLAHFLGRLVELAGGAYLPALLGISWTAFPLILLSSLEADSLLVPLSVPVVHSLWRRAGGWLAFYVVSTVAVGLPLLLLLMLAATGSQFVAALIGAPVIAAALFIEARLLGRLGWLISQPDGKPPKKKRRRQRAPSV
jgi:DNA-directed RNA polymerase subunit RPC12/RpoP